jgi:gentisate 1,2-dioxygenase
MAYRWVHTDAALRAQLELEAEGHPGVTEPGHAAVRFTNPTTGGDALATMPTEMHRLRAGTATARTRTTASSSVPATPSSFPPNPQRSTGKPSSPS